MNNNALLMMLMQNTIASVSAITLGTYTTGYIGSLTGGSIYTNVYSNGIAKYNNNTVVIAFQYGNSTTHGMYINYGTINNENSITWGTPVLVGTGTGSVSQYTKNIGLHIDGNNIIVTYSSYTGNPSGNGCDFKYATGTFDGTTFTMNAIAFLICAIPSDVIVINGLIHVGNNKFLMWKNQYLNLYSIPFGSTGNISGVNGGSAFFGGNLDNDICARIIKYSSGYIVEVTQNRYTSFTSYSVRHAYALINTTANTITMASTAGSYYPTITNYKYISNVLNTTYTEQITKGDCIIYDYGDQSFLVSSYINGRVGTEDTYFGKQVVSKVSFTVSGTVITFSVEKKYEDPYTSIISPTSRGANYPYYPTNEIFLKENQIKIGNQILIPRIYNTGVTATSNGTTVLTKGFSFYNISTNTISQFMGYNSDYQYLEKVGDYLVRHYQNGYVLPYKLTLA